MSFLPEADPWRAFPLLVGILMLATAGTGAWFWSQTQPAAGLASAAAPPPPVPDARPDLAATKAAAPQPTDAARMVPPESPPSAGSGRDTGSGDASAAEVRGPIRITGARVQVNPAIARAYRALTAGDPDGARQDYEQVLMNEPNNGDALHGLAAISLQQGQFGEAEGFYLRMLGADPTDAAAHAGLIALRHQADPVRSESRLKMLLASQPDSPFLNFALGNLYAAQGRWKEAQQAYFRSHAADGENPDYLFNLAISLEQLRQPGLALQRYQAALEAAAHRPASFDRKLVADRVRELQE